MRSCAALLRQDAVSRADTSACGSLTVRRHRVLQMGKDREEQAYDDRLPRGEGDHRWRTVVVRATCILQHHVPALPGFTSVSPPE
jgi:hypothetical protein